MNTPDRTDPRRFPPKRPTSSRIWCRSGRSTDSRGYVEVKNPSAGTGSDTSRAYICRGWARIRPRSAGNGSIMPRSTSKRGGSGATPPSKGRNTSRSWYQPPLEAPYGCYVEPLVAAALRRQPLYTPRCNVDELVLGHAHSPYRSIRAVRTQPVKQGVCRHTQWDAYVAHARAETARCDRPSRTRKSSPEHHPNTPSQPKIHQCIPRNTPTHHTSTWCLRLNHR